MGQPTGRSRLSKRALRELNRMNESRRSLAVYVGQQSEETAKYICQELQQAGLIQGFWFMPKNSVMDHRGVDIVCKTPRGYFLINVKKSSAGVNSFEQIREKMLLAHDARGLPIFP